MHSHLITHKIQKHFSLQGDCECLDPYHMNPWSIHVAQVLAILAVWQQTLSLDPISATFASRDVVSRLVYQSECMQ